MSNAANDNTVGSTVEKRNGTVTYRNVQDRTYTRAGVEHLGSAAKGQHAMVTPGKRIVLWGTNNGRSHQKLAPYRLEFKVGDRAVYDAFNFEYVGTIVAIGEKTITVRRSDTDGHAKRLSIYQFNHYNRAFDLAEIEKRRAEWMD